MMIIKSRLEETKKWIGTNIDALSQHLESVQCKNLLLTIKSSTIESTIPIYNCKIIHNKMKIIIVNNGEFELTINIDPEPKAYQNENKSIFKIEYQFDGEILFEFFN